MTAGALEAGRQAFEERSWATAYDLLATASVSGGVDAADTERLATAAYLSGHDEASADAWTQAHQARLDAGEIADAVRCAFWLGYGLVARGEVARGGGWMARARSLVDEHRLDSVEAAYVLVYEALVALHGADPERALALFGQAIVTARRFGDADLDALAMLGCGQAHLGMGRIVDGVEHFDQAMVSVMADAVSPTVAGIVYCGVINECTGVFDVRRANEWTAALDRWCGDQPGLVPYRGQCLVHRSQVLQFLGSWQEALDEAVRARKRLEQPLHPALGMAHYQLGEMHRLRGDFAAAERAYQQAHEFGRNPQPGLSLLRLAQRRLDGAVAAIERSMVEVEDRPSRIQLLPAYVEIMLAARFVDKARAAAAELEQAAADVGGGYLDAAASHAKGAVLLSEERPGDALRTLRTASQGWNDLEAPYEAARTRILIGAACSALDDREGADLEFRAARRIFEDLGAIPDLSRLERVFGHHEGAGPRITPREMEVLALVAAGATNRDIAAQLYISEKTVERHISNIFTKIGVANRAAATAYAYDHGLV